MPSVASNNGFDAKRFAALMAGFDTGNPCEAEAMNKGRAMRRMVVAAGLRFVDVMERADVKKALDDQMEPVREASAELKEARQKVDEWRKEVSERIQQVKQYAELLTEERKITADLRRELTAAQRAGNQAKPAPQPSPPTGGGSSDGGLVNGVLVAVFVVIVAALLVASVLH